MFKCMFIRRKLYDYLDGSLSEMDKIAVGEHLDVCDNCRVRFGQMKNIVELAGQKSKPEPDEKFWHNFRIGLDRKLNEALIPPVKTERRMSFGLKPAFAYVAMLVVVLSIGAYLYKFPYRTQVRATQEEELVKEALLLDDLGGSFRLNGEEDAYLEEIDLVYQIS